MSSIKQIIKFIIFLRFINYIYNRIILKINNVKIPLKLNINGRVYITNKGKIIFGNNIRINSGKNFNVIGGGIRTNITVLKNAIFEIGNNVGLSNSTFFCQNSITIEDDVLIGGNCKFYDTNFHSLNYDSRLNPYKNNTPDETVKTSPIMVKKGAWIGGHCIVLKGVTIGEKSIVGAGSVVTKNIPEKEIWAGNPAKYIRNI